MVRTSDASMNGIDIHYENYVISFQLVARLLWNLFPTKTPTPKSIPLKFHQNQFNSMTCFCMWYKQIFFPFFICYYLLWFVIVKHLVFEWRNWPWQWKKKKKQIEKKKKTCCVSRIKTNFCRLLSLSLKKPWQEESFVQKSHKIWSPFFNDFEISWFFRFFWLFL